MAPKVVASAVIILLVIAAVGGLVYYYRQANSATHAVVQCDISHPLSIINGSPGSGGWPVNGSLELTVVWRNCANRTVSADFYPSGPLKVRIVTSGTVSSVDADLRQGVSGVGHLSLPAYGHHSITMFADFKSPLTSNSIVQNVNGSLLPRDSVTHAILASDIAFTVYPELVQTCDRFDPRCNAAVLIEYAGVILVVVSLLVIFLRRTGGEPHDDRGQATQT